MRKPETDALLLAWRETLNRRRHEAAVLDRGGEVLRTFEAIEGEAQEIAETRLNGLVPGTVLALQIGNHPAWPAWLLACLLRRVVVLPLETTMTRHELDGALQVCRAAAVVFNGSDTLEMAEIAQAPAGWHGPPPALLKLTSGTTAAPRAIRFRSEQLLADCIQICRTMGIDQRDLNFGVIPVSHSYGFSNLLTPLLACGVSLVLSRDRMPRAVLDDIARTRATIFPGMPVFYQALIALRDVPPLPRLRLCISAGAPLPLRTATQFRDKFGQSIHSFYGSSECGGICYDRAAQLGEEGFVGEAMDGVQVEALDPGTNATRIRVRSAAAGDGYFPEPDEERLGAGSFTPDDLVARAADGFRIVGRVSDLINVAGKKVNPAEVEAALVACEGVREAVVFGRASVLRNEEVAACVVAARGVSEPAVLEFLRQRLSGWQVPKQIFFLPELPVSARGKISRRALAERFAFVEDEKRGTRSD